jgi:hypothetical protein
MQRHAPSSRVNQVNVGFIAHMDGDRAITLDENEMAEAA